MSALDHLPDFKEALQLFKGLAPILLGYFKVDLDDSRSSKSQRMVDLLTEFSLIDLVCHFQKYRRFRDLKTWTQVRQGTVICLIFNYILRTYQLRFKVIRIWDMCNYMSNHFEIRAIILRRPT